MTCRSLASSLLLVSVAAALAGCNESHTTGGDAAPDSPGIVFDLDGAMFDGGVDAPIAPVTVGTACTADTDCTGDGAICLAGDPDFIPGGYCSQVCDPGGGDPMCPTGSTCVSLGGGEAYCLRDCDPSVTERQCRAGYGCSTSPMLPPVCVGGCTDDTDCASGLSCDPTGGFIGSGVCFTPGAAPGDACVADSDCPAGGFCASEEGNGFVGGACVIPDCDIATNAGCDGGSCYPGGMGGGGAPAGICAGACTTTADCRTGYTCEAVEGGGGRMYCAPNCTSDDQCTIAGYVCNEGIGRCAPPFAAGSLGDTCSRFDPSTCTGGSCLSERTTGFPMAYCAYAGCATPGDSCPTDIGGICVADPVGSGTNYCFLGCTADTDCRPGYACLPSIPGDATSSGACQPRCTDSAQCGSTMRTCDTTSGLCR